MCGGIASLSNGGSYDQCWRYSPENRGWTQTPGRLMRKRSAAGWVAHPTLGLVISGGVTESTIIGLDTMESTTDGVTFNRNFARLPTRLFCHCMVLINSDEMLAIGGFNVTQWTPNIISSRKVYRYSEGANAWSELPSLNTARWAHSCGFDRSSNSVVAAGGRVGASDVTSLTSVEILNLRTMRWSTGTLYGIISLDLSYYILSVAGTPLPVGVSHAGSMPFGSSFLFMGGAPTPRSSVDTIYKYESGRWVLLSERLPRALAEFMAFPVDKTQFPDCS